MRKEQSWKDLFQGDSSIQEPDFHKMWSNIEKKNRKKVRSIKPVVALTSGILSLLLIVSITYAEPILEFFKMTVGNQSYVVVNDENFNPPNPSKNKPELDWEAWEERQATRAEISEIMGINIVEPYVPEGFTLKLENGQSTVPVYNDEGEVIRIEENFHRYEMEFRPPFATKHLYNSNIIIKYQTDDAGSHHYHFDYSEPIEFQGLQGIKHEDGWKLFKEVEDRVIIIDVIVPHRLEYEESIKILESIVENL